MTSGGAGSPAGLDPQLLDPTRLAIVAVLAAARWVEFAYVRDAVGISDSALSKQSANLERGGYLAVRKGHVGRRPRTWFRATDHGRAALVAHLTALQEVVDAAGRAAPADEADPQPTEAGTRPAPA